jgi:RNA polymerase sigma factor (sigma-70 family)
LAPSFVVSKATAIMTPLFATKQSDDRGFERLYRAHVQDVYRYALMVLRNPTDAEDVAQTTFLKAYRALQRGHRPRHARQWLITIAHNTCRTRLRDAKRRPQEVALEPELADTMPRDEDVDVRELVKALGALSFNQRAALVMRELEGRSYADIAEVLDVSGAAVETLLFRARRALREQLEGPLSCGETERALSLQLDGRLPGDERVRLRAHLRECGECASLARRQRARRAALRSLGPLPLPASLASWGTGAIGTGIATKAAAILAAGVVAAGTASYDFADAVSQPSVRAGKASQPAPRTRAQQAPRHAAAASQGVQRPGQRKAAPTAGPRTAAPVAAPAEARPVAAPEAAPTTASEPAQAGVPIAVPTLPAPPPAPAPLPLPEPLPLPQLPPPPELLPLPVELPPLTTPVPLPPVPEIP